MWYVIQIETGTETTVQKLISGIVPTDFYEDLRIIRYESKRRYAGAWHMEKKNMFPGYLFLITDHIEDVFFALKRVPRLTKLLRPDQKMTPLAKEEAEVLDRLSGGKGLVKMSFGIKEGDQIKVTKGCLMGMESRIVKIDRHKRKAIIEIELFGEKRKAEVGLEILLSVQ